jgi:hypothetical protein
MLTRDEFESAWDVLIGKYGLRDHPFMIRVYECREKWAKPFSSDKFYARMMSTQRVESANHMLKIYIPRNSPMNRFVLQYNTLLFDRSVEEDREEHLTKQVTQELVVSIFFSGEPMITRFSKMLWLTGVLFLTITDEETISEDVASATPCCKNIYKSCIQVVHSGGGQGHTLQGSRDCEATRVRSSSHERRKERVLVSCCFQDKCC